MNKKQLVTFLMVLLILFASVSMVVASVNSSDFSSDSDMYTTVPVFEGASIAGFVVGAGAPTGG